MKRFPVVIIITALLFLDIFRANADPLQYEKSAFGMFGVYSSEFPGFCERMNLSQEDYFDWATEHMKRLGGVLIPSRAFFWKVGVYLDEDVVRHGLRQPR